MHAKKRIFLITALLYIFYTIFPLFADTFNIPVWLPSMFAVAVMLILYPKAFANKAFYWFLIYAFVLLFNLMLGRPLTVGIGKLADSRKILIELAFILPSLSMACILLYLKDIELNRKLVRWSVIILYASFIVTLPLMLSYNSIREALMEQNEESFSVPGLPGYTLMHAYTFFLPVMCYVTKAVNVGKKWLAIAGLSVLCFVIYDTFVTTSLLVMIACIVFTIFYSDKSNLLFFFIFGILALLLYIMYKAGVFISLIDWIMPAFEGTPVEFKLNDFRDSMLQGQLTGGSITGRMDFHDVSKGGFISNPIFGSSVSGGHSSLLDRLGGMGLVGALPFIMMFIAIFRQMYKLYTTKLARAFFFVGVIVGFVFLYNKGLFGSEGWLVYTVLMPIGILSFEYKVNNNETA
ncbi:MAG: hypothetical protein J6P83_00495 [Bacteroidales bacterium]|nr:hypothetical protein [Bacteroidales bacterium]